MNNKGEVMAWHKKKNDTAFKVDGFIVKLCEQFKKRTGKEITRERVVEICLRIFLKKVEESDVIEQILRDLEQE
jgi:hypothetical protein